MAARAARGAPSAPEGRREAARSAAQRRWVPRSGAKRRRRRLSGGRAASVGNCPILRLRQSLGTKLHGQHLKCLRCHRKSPRNPR
eukprot:scaffold66488_cov27-Phaeocystis_antarctica.AAC.1